MTAALFHSILRNALIDGAPDSKTGEDWAKALDAVVNAVRREATIAARSPRTTKTWDLWTGTIVEPGRPARSILSDRVGAVEFQKDGMTFVRWDIGEETCYGYAPGELLVQGKAT